MFLSHHNKIFYFVRTEKNLQNYWFLSHLTCFLSIGFVHIRLPLLSCTQRQFCFLGKSQGTQTLFPGVPLYGLPEHSGIFPVESSQQFYHLKLLQWYNIKKFVWQFWHFHGQQGFEFPESSKDRNPPNNILYPLSWYLTICSLLKVYFKRMSKCSVQFSGAETSNSAKLKDVIS